MGKDIFLNIYKASAGSGKTFTLTADYIGHLIADPQSYRYILAVTFTNRATEEMKLRILSGLYGIAHRLPETQGYIERLKNSSEHFFNGKVPNDIEISERASEALSNLLHHYSYFRIETIDSFFQRVFRNLARELNLTANLRVELNDLQIEEQAVDELIDNLTAKDEVLTWLMEYITEHIDEDKTWNVIGAIKVFGRHIFKEHYKENAESLQGIRFDEIRKLLKHTRDNARDKMRSIADAFFNDLTANSIEENELSYKEKGAITYFKKLRNGVFNESIFTKRVSEVLSDSRKWSPKNSKKGQLIVERAETVWNPLIQEAEKIRPRQYKLFQSAHLTLRHLNQLRLLGHIEKRVNVLNETSNRFLLSNTQHLLSDLIQKSDSPFVFEKIGTGLKHIMIDEFQDTSTIQWRNFKLLLTECMSHGNRSLIVGDVKQSIYRWRSGDWQLLNNIQEEFPHMSKHLYIENLDTNFRSEKKIIVFNNYFFQTAVEHEQQKLSDEGIKDYKMYARAYADVKQQLPESREKRDEGYVHIELFPQEHYQKNVLQKVTETVKELIFEKGFSSHDIAILVRINRDIPIIANHLMEYLPSVKIVSDEAFLLKSSLAVNIIINALKVLNTPNDILTKASLAKSYQNEILQNSLPDSVILVGDKQLSDFLPEEFTEKQAELSALPLIDLTEKLYNIFHIERLEGQNSYISTLYDTLNDFLHERTPDLNAFLKEWESNFAEKTIQCDEIDGVRLISIHKSKGLEFPHVIIPFCDWQLEQQETIWCKPKEEPFSTLPIVPINYTTKSLKGTIYEKDYQHEHLQNTVDNMNLLYVAFTRACKSLTVYGKRDKSNIRSQIIQEILPEITKQLEKQAVFEDNGKDSNMLFTYGILSCHNKQTEEKKLSKNIFLNNPAPKKIAIKSFDAKIEFRQSNKSQKFIGEYSQIEEQHETYIKMGNVLHQIFSQIRTTDDIKNVVEQLRRDGILYQKDITEKKINGLLKQITSNKKIADWFSDKWEIFNESSIITKDEKGNTIQYRPDRVMTNQQQTIVVDFKFGYPRKEYIPQVQQYMRLLASMGYKNVSGYLWFVYTNKIEKVEMI